MLVHNTDAISRAAFDSVHHMLSMLIGAAVAAPVAALKVYVLYYRGCIGDKLLYQATELRCKPLGADAVSWGQ